MTSTPADHGARIRMSCPKCLYQHIDRGEWATREHKTHQCQHCGHEWRPFDVPTFGVCAACLSPELEQVASLTAQLSEATAAAEAAKKDAERNFRWSYQLLLAFAMELLRRANQNLESPNDWPAGQKWHEMVGSSHAIFLRMAREAAGVSNDEYLAIVRSAEYFIDDLYEAAAEGLGGTD